MEWKKAPWVDLTLGTFAVLMAAETLPHPFGRDQGLYFYIGREWFLRGKLPYRDSFDVKTPFIYVLNGISAWLFGDHMWGPRVLDAIALLCLGLVCARLGTPKGERMREGTIGVALLTASIAYFGCFDFWNTAQCEVWCTLFATASLLVGLQTEPRLRNALGAGVLGGLAVLAKPPSGLVCVLAVGAFVARVFAEASGSRASRAGKSAVLVAAYGIGASIFPLIVFGHIVAKGGGSAMYDVLVVNNRHYVVHGKWVHSYRDAIRRTRAALHGFDPLGTLLWLPLAATAAREWKLRNRPELVRRLLPFALVVCSIAAVWAQMKFPEYHWGGMVAPVTVGAVVVHRDLRDWAKSKEWPEWRGSVLAAGILVYAFYANAPIYDRWIRSTWATVSYLKGTIPRESYLGAYTNGPWSTRESEAASQWLKDHKWPDDRLAVRGFEPQIYEMTGMQAHGRFFWTTFLVVPEWSYRIDEWLAEDRRIFETNPPRWVIALDWVHEGPDSAEYFYPLGYRRIVAFNHELVILEYCPDGLFPSILVRDKSDPGTPVP